MDSGAERREGERAAGQPRAAGNDGGVEPDGFRPCRPGPGPAPQRDHLEEREGIPFGDAADTPGSRSDYTRRNEAGWGRLIEFAACAFATQGATDLRSRKRRNRGIVGPRRGRFAGRFRNPAMGRDARKKTRGPRNAPWEPAGDKNRSVDGRGSEPFEAV